MGCLTFNPSAIYSGLWAGLPGPDSDHFYHEIRSVVPLRSHRDTYTSEIDPQDGARINGFSSRMGVRGG